MDDRSAKWKQPKGAALPHSNSNSLFLQGSLFKRSSLFLFFSKCLVLAIMDPV